MARNLEHEFDTLKSDIATLQSDIKSFTSAFSDTASDKFSQYKIGAQKKFDRLSEKAKSQTREALEDLAEEIEDRPLTSIFMAFAAGLILGRLLDL